jgi:hypothetical protein
LRPVPVKVMICVWPPSTVKGISTYINGKSK